MSDTKFALDLTKVPFGRSHSGIMVYEEDNCDGWESKPGLFFVMLTQGGAPRRQGLVDIDPIVDGQSQPYTYECTPGCLVLATDCGKVTVVIDTPRTMRIRGEGVGVRLYTKIPFMTMENATLLPGDMIDLNLSSINMDGGRFLFKSLKGRMTLDSFFNVQLNGPEDAKVEFLPDDDGVFEVAGYLMNPDEWGYIDYESVEDAAAGAEAEYEAFAKRFPEVSEEWQELKDIASYSIWLHTQGPNDREIIPKVLGDLVYSNALTAGWAKMFDQPLQAMAVRDAGAAYQLITDAYKHMVNGMPAVTISTSKLHYQACPPVFGAAVMALMRNGEEPDAETAKQLYDSMSANFDWWKKSHSFSENRFSYSHRDEIGLPGVSYSALEFPLETPDLYTFMILHAAALARLSRIADDGREAEWTDAQEKMTKELMSLWNGEQFECRAAVSGQRYASYSVLSYLPVILGDLLPAEVTDKLADALGDEEQFLSSRGFRSESVRSGIFDPSVAGRGAVTAWIQMLLFDGLRNARKAETAEKAAERFLAYARENGPRDVFDSEGEQPVRRAGDQVDPLASAAVIYIAGQLGR